MCLLALFGVTSAQAVTTLYTNESDYLTALAGLGFVDTTIQESFEDGPPWPRFLSSADSVSNQGITWSRLASHADTVGLTTSNADAHEGSYQMFTLDSSTLQHALPDGYSLAASDLSLYGVGGWFSGNNTKLGFTVDGDSTRVDFAGDQATVLDWTFLGFVEDNPALAFSRVEIIAIEDTGGDRQTFFSDDFTLAGQTTVVPLPASLPLFGTGLLAVGGFLRRRGKRL
jgi:hypothetical protein